VRPRPVELEAELYTIFSNTGRTNSDGH
jgi:hypothetical protein